MKPEEIRASGQLATWTGGSHRLHAEQAHRVAAARMFAFTAPASLPARVIHDVIATGVYTSIRGTSLVAGMAASEIVSAAGGSTPPGRLDCPEQPGIGRAECDLGG